MARVNPPTKPWTAEDLLRAGSSAKHYELWDGTVLVREPSGGPAEVVAGRIYGPLWNYVEKRGLGWVTMSNQGFLIARDPDRVLAPDAAFTARERMPTVPRRGFFPCAPDFAVEVRSPTDTWIQVVEKCGIWIAHGCAVVWGVDPEGRQVAVFRPGRTPEVMVDGQAADADPLLPDFRVPVSDLFREI